MQETGSQDALKIEDGSDEAPAEESIEESVESLPNPPPKKKTRGPRNKKSKKPSVSKEPSPERPAPA